MGPFIYIGEISKYVEEEHVGRSGGEVARI